MGWGSEIFHKLNKLGGQNKLERGLEFQKNSLILVMNEKIEMNV